MPTHLCIHSSLVLPHSSQRVSTSSFPRFPYASAVNLHLTVATVLDSARSSDSQSFVPEIKATMVKARSVFAAASAGSMHDGAVQMSTDRLPDVVRLQSSSTKAPTDNGPEITRRDVHTASSVNTQRRFPKPAAKEPNLAHQAALRRVKGKDVATQPAPVSHSAITSKPVLVRKPSSKTDMRKKQKPVINTRSRSPKLPPIESFSFQDILASIGPEVDESIDAIAEICGRSKMSLAEEHASHRPPQGDIQFGQNSPADSVPPMRLETVEETRPEGPITRARTKALALANASQAGASISSEATAAASNIVISGHTSTTGFSDPAQASLLPQILAWLRRANPTGANDGSSSAGKDDGAMRALHNLLHDTATVQS